MGKRGHKHIMRKFLNERHICRSCSNGDCNGCTGSARLPDETHLVGMGRAKPCPSFTICECHCNLTSEAV